MHGEDGAEDLRVHAECGGRHARGGWREGSVVDGRMLLLEWREA